ncbi:GNAT family N-acetyltransferase [Streptomyces sp. NPDC048664]|uniref:GNAT family N-acetyltransferase n=1 Tax=Streptomyces sp. NPDC048664 TaxID=3154505 RepID=UPI0034230EC9
MDGTLRIRDMTLADCRSVSDIRIRGWRATYRGFVPQSYLDRLDVDADAERRRARLVEGGDVVNLVAERDGAVVGWAAHGPFQDGEVRTADGELYALYVEPELLGGGIGHALLSAALRQRAAAGHARMFLWVLNGNVNGRRFYERAGFRADGTEQSFEVDGVAVAEMRYGAVLPARG